MAKLLSRAEVGKDKGHHKCTVQGPLWMKSSKNSPHKGTACQGPSCGTLTVVFVGSGAERKRKGTSKGRWKALLGQGFTQGSRVRTRRPRAGAQPGPHFTGFVRRGRGAQDPLPCHNVINRRKYPTPNPGNYCVLDSIALYTFVQV